MNLALNTSFVYALQGGWTLSNAASAAERFCFLFFFNNFRPKHTIEAADTQKSSVRCTWKESSHRQGFDSLSPNNRQTGCRKSPQPLSQAEQKDRIQRLLGLRNQSFPLCFPFLFRPHSSRYLFWPLAEMPNCHSSKRCAS